MDKYEIAKAIRKLEALMDKQDREKRVEKLQAAQRGLIEGLDNYQQNEVRMRHECAEKGINFSEFYAEPRGWRFIFA